MALQVTLELDRAFFSLVSDPTQVVACGTAGSIGGGGGRSDVSTQEGAFRTYANNVTRLILGAAKTRVNSLALIALTPDQVTTLEGMVGKTVLFRDTYGRRIYGSFLITTRTDRPLSGRPNETLKTDIAIDFQQVTYDEGV